MMSSICADRPAHELAGGSGGDCSPSSGSNIPYHERQAELEYRLLVLVDRLRARIAVVATELGLTPQQAMLLRHLGQPRAMGDIAVAFGCDRSNVTGLVDRMATRGLVERVADRNDRRVKYLVLTEEGQAQRARLQERFFAQSPSTSGLAPAERHQLLLLLRKLTHEFPHPPAPSPSALGEGDCAAP